MNWIIENSAVLVASVIGVIGALMGVIITNHTENKRRSDAEKAKARPIIINFMRQQMPKDNSSPKYVFNADDERTGSLVGCFKNATDSLLFLEKIETEKKTYYPKHSSVVDKNSSFYIILDFGQGETLRKPVIYCSDIYGTQYYYTAQFNLNSNSQSQIIIDNITPISCKKRA